MMQDILLACLFLIIGVIGYFFIDKLSAIFAAITFEEDRYDASRFDANAYYRQDESLKIEENGLDEAIE